MESQQPELPPRVPLLQDIVYLLGTLDPFELLDTKIDVSNDTRLDLGLPWGEVEASGIELVSTVKKEISRDSKMKLGLVSTDFLC